MSPDPSASKRPGGPAPRGDSRRLVTARPSAAAQARARERRAAAYQEPRLVLGPLNYGLMGAGLVAVVVGFVLLAQNEISLAPLLLVLGYCVLIPAGLLIERVSARGGKEGSATETGGE